MTGQPHEHLWCVQIDWATRLVLARCRCGLNALGLRALAAVDRPAAMQVVDPDGVQRGFCEAAGLEPVVPLPKEASHG